jgi:hypothetical protein
VSSAGLRGRQGARNGQVSGTPSQGAANSQVCF